jgi:hypothetical protein
VLRGRMRDAGSLVSDARQNKRMRSGTVSLPAIDCGAAPRPSSLAAIRSPPADAQGALAASSCWPHYPGAGTTPSLPTSSEGPTRPYFGTRLFEQRCIVAPATDVGGHLPPGGIHCRG